MKDFIKYTLASMVGVMLVGLFTFVMCSVMFCVFAALGKSTPSLSENSILHIQLKGTLQERAEEENPFAELFGNGELTVQGLDKLVAAINEAKTNDKVIGIYLDGGTMMGDFASLGALRKALVDFKTSKKFVVAYADNYTQGSYYVASAADKVTLNPAGMLDWHGIASNPVFYTGLMEKLGVKMQVFKVGTYKSAVEPYILTKMSDANREQVNALISDIWNGIVKAVSASRKITADSLNAYANRYVSMADAKEHQRIRLVDQLGYIDQVRADLRKRSGDEKVSLIAAHDLAQLANPASSTDRVAVYFAEGAIVDIPNTGALMGESLEIVGQQVVSDLDKLANDKDVKAVVLRINSGGGSAYASEQMWRAIQLLRQKKPVIVSMGGAAASGGYYMACGAHRIFAEPSTITGSIGIFGRIPDASNLLTQKLGLSFDVVKTNESADFGTMGRPFSAAEGVALQAHVDRGYQLFLKRVADGRTAAGKKLTMEDVDKIGQGRVWTGNQALKNGLVDQLGSLQDAIAYASKQAKLKNYTVDTYPATSSWLEQLEAKTDQSEYFERKLQQTLGVYYEPLTFLQHTQQSDILQARMFFLLNLQ